MSKAIKDSGRSSRQVRGGGAGRRPGDSGAVRATPSFMDLLFGSSSPKPPANLSARGDKTRPTRRGGGQSSDTSKPSGRWWL